MGSRRAGPVIAAAAVMLATAPAQAEPLPVRYAVWVGYGPLFLAQDKGFFADEGVLVELVNIDDHTAALAALYAGHVDAMATATQDVVAFSESGEEPQACVLALTDSTGGDGILAANDIKTVADLEGRSVAFIDRSISQFYLNVLLSEAGLSEADIEVVDLPPDQATEAFMLGEVDATVTWEPFLTEGGKAGHGHLLTDTSERPGLLGDCLATTPKVFAAGKKQFRAVARAWERAVRYTEERPDESYRIMAWHMGDWLADPAVFAEILRGVAFYDAEDNRRYFGEPDSPGQIYETMQHVIDVWSELGMLKLELEPADVIIHGIFEE